MVSIMTTYFQNLSEQERKAKHGPPGIKNGHLRPRLTFRRELDGIVESKHAFERVEKCGAAAPQLSRVRHGKQNFIVDRLQNRWVKIATEV